MKFSEKLPAFANPQGAAGKLLIASMNIFHTPVSLWGSSPRSRDRHRSFTGLRELFFYAQPQCHCGRTVFRL